MTRNDDQFGTLVALLKEGEGVKVEQDLSLTKLEASQVADLAKLNPDKTFYAIMVCRPGAIKWMSQIEEQLYPPDKHEDNIKFGLTFIRWAEMTWAVASVPSDDDLQVRDLTMKIGMRIANGVPFVLGMGPNPVAFPIQGKNVFTIEGKTQKDEE